MFLFVLQAKVMTTALKTAGDIKHKVCLAGTSLAGLAFVVKLLAVSFYVPLRIVLVPRSSKITKHLLLITERNIRNTHSHILPF